MPDHRRHSASARSRLSCPRMRRLALVLPAAILVLLLAAAVNAASPTAPPPGPPFPNPEVGRAVYDYAGILSPAAIADAEAKIDAIEERTGAEIVVYTQNSGEYPTTEETEQKAQALGEQWKVGRAGFNDGLVIFFDMQPNLQHGQVQLDAGTGFEDAFLSNEERQSIFDNDMLPLPAQRRLRRRPRGRDGEDRRGDDRRACPVARARSPVQCRPGPDRRPDRVPRPDRLGVLQLATLRQGPGLPGRCRRS